jgi:predicted metalloprotease with PDZ domain
MRLLPRNRSVLYSALIAFLCLFGSVARSQNRALEIRYDVQVGDPANQQFHVSTVVRNIRQARLDLSLPVWTPGWYTIENYAVNILRFQITDAAGKPLHHTMSRKQTWNVDTRGVSEIHVDFDYRATVLALNQARIDRDFAFFTGTQLFLEVQGHRNQPSTVHVSVPSGWRIISALKETADPSVFEAANYDVLVDSPVEMGHFDVTRFEVQGKPHYFVANPAGAFSQEKTKRFTEMLAKVAQAEGAIFGGLPYDKYVHFYFFLPPESNASGALEHLNSFVSFAPPANVAQPEQMIGGAAHEFFHLWNVKRIRPAEMWPYDYSRETETPLLWVSEGFTNYYAGVGQYRAGLMNSDAFVQRAAGAAGEIESSPARKFISPAESSVSTWTHYDTQSAFDISYYTQGQNLAALLDLSIRNDTDGRASLDDVIRTLYNDHYKRGRGFTTENLIGIVNRLTKRDYAEFFRRYVFSTDVPDYDRIFGYAGYSVQKASRQLPEVGFGARSTNEGFTLDQIEPNSPASRAGLHTGDVVLKVNGASPSTIDPNTLAGKTVTLTINRNGVESAFPLKVGVIEAVRYTLVPMSQPSPKQLQVRESWLRIPRTQ